MLRQLVNLGKLDAGRHLPAETVRDTTASEACKHGDRFLNCTGYRVSEPAPVALFWDH